MVAVELVKGVRRGIAREVCANSTRDIVKRADVTRVAQGVRTDAIGLVVNQLIFVDEFDPSCNKVLL